MNSGTIGTVMVSPGIDHYTLANLILMYDSKGKGPHMSASVFPAPSNGHFTGLGLCFFILQIRRLDLGALLSCPCRTLCLSAICCCFSSDIYTSVIIVREKKGIVFVRHWL